MLLEIVSWLHYDAPYDFYDMKMTWKIMKKWFPEARRPLSSYETIVKLMDFSAWAGELLELGLGRSRSTAEGQGAAFSFA